MTLKPAWQRPPGMPPGAWDYVHSSLVAEDYDNYFQFHGLFQLDQQFVQAALARRGPGVVVDLGCGTGRHVLPLLKSGQTVIGVDFSHSMLKCTAERVHKERRRVNCVQCDLVQLDALGTGIADAVLCMFSTLGMIQGRLHRRAVLGHARRILKPGGRLLLHVHNLGFQFFEPAGWRTLLLGYARQFFFKEYEWGDNEFPYRGVPRMFLHAYRRRELRQDLRQAGFQLLQLMPVAASGREPLPARWWLPSLRAAGWLVEACPA